MDVFTPHLLKYAYVFPKSIPCNINTYPDISHLIFYWMRFSAFQYFKYSLKADNSLVAYYCMPESLNPEVTSLFSKLKPIFPNLICKVWSGHHSSLILRHWKLPYFNLGLFLIPGSFCLEYPSLLYAQF